MASSTNNDPQTPGRVAPAAQVANSPAQMVLSAKVQKLRDAIAQNKVPRGIYNDWKILMANGSSFVPRVSPVPAVSSSQEKSSQGSQPHQASQMSESSLNFDYSQGSISPFTQPVRPVLERTISCHSLAAIRQAVKR